jgi:hypothetical protein
MRMVKGVTERFHVYIEAGEICIYTLVPFGTALLGRPGLRQVFAFIRSRQPEMFCKPLKLHEGGWIGSMTVGEPERRKIKYDS